MEAQRLALEMYQCPLYRAFFITFRSLDKEQINALINVSMPSISGFLHYVALENGKEAIEEKYQCPLYRAFFITTAFSPSFDQLYHF